MVSSLPHCAGPLGKLWGNLKLRGHFTPCLVTARLILDPRLQQDPKINPLQSPALEPFLKLQLS